MHNNKVTRAWRRCPNRSLGYAFSGQEKTTERLYDLPRKLSSVGSSDKNSDYERISLHPPET